MPTFYDSPDSDVSNLGRLFWQSLAELPLRAQLRLFREMKLPAVDPDLISSQGVSVGRPFIYVTDYLPDMPSGLLNNWLESHKDALAFELIRHHGLDLDRIALLYEFDVLKPPPIKRVGVKTSFADEDAESPIKGDLDLRQLTLVANMLLEFDAAFRSVFDPLELLTERPEVRLASGTVTSWLTKSAAGIGLLILLDVASHGASLPFTIPIYAKLAAAGTMAAGGAARFIVEERKEWAIGTKTFNEADKIAAEAAAIRLKGEPEAEKIKAEAEKTRAEADKFRADEAKARAEALKSRAETNKITIETLLLTAKSPEETEKARAEIEKLVADTAKSRAETEALQRGQSEEMVTTSPPSSMVPKDLIEDSAYKHNVEPAIVALAINVGYPILDRAHEDGMRLSLLDDDSG